MSETPLASADPDSLTAIFTSDPLTLTDDQLHRAIIELRRRRNAFLSEEAAKAAAGKAKRPKAQASSAEKAALIDKPPAELSLDDLD